LAVHGYGLNLPGQLPGALEALRAVMCYTLMCYVAAAWHLLGLVVLYFKRRVFFGFGLKSLRVVILQGTKVKSK